MLLGSNGACIIIIKRVRIEVLWKRRMIWEFLDVIKGASLLLAVVRARLLLSLAFATGTCPLLHRSPKGISLDERMRDARHDDMLQVLVDARGLELTAMAFAAILVGIQRVSRIEPTTPSVIVVLWLITWHNERNTHMRPQYHADICI